MLILKMTVSLCTVLVISYFICRRVDARITVTDSDTARKRATQRQRPNRKGETAATTRTNRRPQPRTSRLPMDNGNVHQNQQRPIQSPWFTRAFFGRQFIDTAIREVPANAFEASSLMVEHLERDWGQVFPMGFRNVEDVFKIRITPFGTSVYKIRALIASLGITVSIKISNRPANGAGSVLEIRASKVQYDVLGDSTRLRRRDLTTVEIGKIFSYADDLSDFINRRQQSM